MHLNKLVIPPILELFLSTETILPAYYYYYYGYYYCFNYSEEVSVSIRELIDNLGAWGLGLFKEF